MRVPPGGRIDFRWLKSGRHNSMFNWGGMWLNEGMARIKLDIDAVRFTFCTDLTVRITDINYGRHVGNDAMLGLLQEARLRYLAQAGFSEEDIGGVGMVMGDAVIQFKAVAFYGDCLTVAVGLQDVGRRTFDLVYRVTRKADQAVVVLAKTGMVAYDYSRNQPANLPDVFLETLGVKRA